MGSGMVHLADFAESVAMMTSGEESTLLFVEDRRQALDATASATITTMNLYSAFIMIFRIVK